MCQNLCLIVGDNSDLKTFDMTFPWDKHINFLHLSESCLQIRVELKLILKVIKANLILDKIRLNVPFNFAIQWSFYVVYKR